jgi:hypothetical protein
MKYEKPEICVLGAATALIKAASLTKGSGIYESDCNGGSDSVKTSCPAYEADE